ncbi:MAG: polysaccharide deacetylase family protein [Myxococcota bacterium]
MTWAFLALLCPSALAGDPVAPAVDEIVGWYRDGLVLAEAARADDDGAPQATALGRMLAARRAAATDALSDALGADAADKGRLTQRFLAALEHDRDLLDGDRLALLDVVAALRVALQAGPRDRRHDALLGRVVADEAALIDLEARYREEAQALGAPGTRGLAGSRQRWDAYLAAVRADRSAEALLRAHADELAAAPTRGLRDNALELYGTSLPEGTFVLSFDDGPSAEHTPEILDILREHGVHAVFFELGDHVADRTARSSRPRRRR